MKRSCTLLMCLGLCIAVSAQDRFWKPITGTNAERSLFKGLPQPKVFQLYSLNSSLFISSTRQAPTEKMTAASRSNVIITVPNAEGQLERFSIVSAPVMHPDLAARYPGIESYAGVNLDHPGSSIRFAVSPQGLNASIYALDRPTVYVDPVAPGSNNYVLVSRKDLALGAEHFTCFTRDEQQNIQNRQGMQLRNADDGLLRTYRLALCASGEFSQHWLNGTETSDAERKAKVLAAQNAEMTRANGIFERDFGVRLVLVANNDAVIYLNPATDPWGSNLNGPTQTTCDNVIGSANYDIGHLEHKAADNGNAGCIACVCKAGSKGSGFTAYSNPSLLDYFVVDYLTHEMGHQLGGNHTFTFQNEGTIAQVEPGSGSSIMGYAGITGSTDVQPHSDDYFHAITIQQVTDYIKTTAGSCSVNTPTGNTAPTANAGANYTIPKSTPFTLTGSGADADAGDVLTYNWEQNDTRGTGSSTVPSATATSGPQFRSFGPSASASRTFPALASILNGSNVNKWEVLPSVQRTLNFRFTVRDSRPGGGANQSDDAIVTVSSTTGPFAVTAPNTAVTWPVGSPQSVTWSVNGTNGTPVNCANVSILLSTDGGQNFDVVLAASTNNDGSETITVPDLPGAANRIKVAAVGNIFFDISNTNFTIGTAAACGDPSVLTASNISSSAATVSWNAASNANSYDVDYKTASSSNWINAATATGSLTVNLSGLQEATNYDWRVRANCSSATGNYIASSFTTGTASSPCPGPYDVSTNGTRAGAANIPLNTDVKGTISSRTDEDYYGFVISNAGSITVTLTNLPANYQLSLVNNSGTQLALSQNNGNTNESITATVSAGTYYARIFPKGNASSATACYTLRVATGTASKIGSPSMEDMISASPNPAVDILQVNIPQPGGASDMLITDQSGRVLLKGRLLQAANTVNVSSLRPGMYLLKVFAGGKTQVLKFIKL